MDAFYALFLLTVALSVAVGGVMLLVSHMVLLPASIAHGWRWAVLVFLLPLVGPFWFAHRHPHDFARVGRQLAVGVALVVFAVGLLYGVGPIFAERIVAGFSKAQTIPSKP